MKPQSVRSQRSFAEHMKTLYQNIDTMVYAGEVACNYITDDGKCNAPTMELACPFLQTWRADRGCKLPVFRMQLGDHFPQGDIKEVELGEG